MRMLVKKAGGSVSREEEARVKAAWLAGEVPAGWKLIDHAGVPQEPAPSTLRQLLAIVRDLPAFVEDRLRSWTADLQRMRAAIDPGEDRP